DLACEFNLFLAPVMSPREMLVNAQLASRDFFAPLGGDGRLPHRLVVTSRADGQAAPTAATKAAPALRSSEPPPTPQPPPVRPPRCPRPASITAPARGPA